jgi:hypothetical protein
MGDCPMKFAVIAFAAAVATVGPAGASTWSDIGCSVFINNDKGGFEYKAGESEPVKCSLTDAQELTCADGKKRHMVAIPDNGIWLDGVELYALGEENPAICD